MDTNISPKFQIGDYVKVNIITKWFGYVDSSYWCDEHNTFIYLIEQDNINLHHYIYEGCIELIDRYQELKSYPIAEKRTEKFYVTKSYLVNTNMTLTEIKNKFGMHDDEYIYFIRMKHFPPIEINNDNDIIKKDTIIYYTKVKC